MDLNSGIKAWAQMTRNCDPIHSFLECGSNIGRNINFLNHLYPSSAKSVIEIGKEPFDIVTNTYKLDSASNTSILDSNFNGKTFDLVFTSGVLIHINPDLLLQTMQKMYDLSSRYILFCEMFSRVPRTVNYRGSDDLFFTRDFGRFFLENFNASIVDYGFLWGHYYDDAGFDDANFWVFEK